MREKHCSCSLPCHFSGRFIYKSLQLLLPSSSHFQYLPEIRCLCFLNLFWQPYYATIRALTEIDLTLNTSRESARPGKQALRSARRPACLHCNYPDCSFAMVDTSAHRGFTMEKTNKDAHLCPTNECNPLSPIIMFVMISSTREAKPASHRPQQVRSSYL